MGVECEQEGPSTQALGAPISFMGEIVLNAGLYIYIYIYI